MPVALRKSLAAFAYPIKRLFEQPFPTVVQSQAKGYKTQRGEGGTNNWRCHEPENDPAPILIIICQSRAPLTTQCTRDCLLEFAPQPKQNCGNSQNYRSK